MKIANNNDLRNAAIAAQKIGDMQTMAALNLIAMFPVEEEDAEDKLERKLQEEEIPF